MARNGQRTQRGAVLLTLTLPTGDVIAYKAQRTPRRWKRALQQLAPDTDTSNATYSRITR